jgi:hypothetical protein
MGATPADTEREINRLRGDMTAALEEVERRLRGGMRGIAGAEARISSGRASQAAFARVERARDNPTLLGVAGVVVVGAVGYGIFAAIRGSRARNTPASRLKRGVKQVRTELGERVEEGVELSLRQLERARPRGLLLKLDPEDGGYMRVVDARVDVPAVKNKGRQDVIKKLVWAGLLSVFMAVGSVLARRLAGTVWQATVREEPPTQKRKAAD